MSDARLQWGATALIAAGATPGLPFSIEASGDGATWGNPAAVISAIQSRLLDGSLASIDSFGNREAPIRVRVKSTTYDGLSLGESALVAESRRPGYNSLTWTPSESLAVPSVFDVVYAVVGWDFDDLSETILERYFTIDFAFLPFPRLADEVVVEALEPPASSTPTSISSCSSTPGWSKPAASSLAAIGGRIRVLGSASEPQWAEFAVSEDMDGDRFVFVDWQWTVNGSGHFLEAFQAMFDGDTDTKTLPVATRAGEEPGYVRSYFLAPATWESVRFTAFSLDMYPGDGAQVTLRLDQVSRIDEIGDGSTARQQFRTIPVPGDVRTQGRLAIEHETDSLGEVLAYVYRNDNSGYLPPLRAHLVDSDSSDIDTGLISGASNMLDTLWGAEVPARAVPDGAYRLYARLRGSGSGTVDLNITASTLMGGSTLPGVILETATVQVTSEWAIYDLTGLSLSPNKLATAAAETNGVVRITIVDANLSGIDVEIDEAWIFNEDLGALTHVDCSGNTESGIDPGDDPAPGGPCNRIWLDPATLTNDGQDAIYTGFAADRSDAFNPGDGIKGWTPPVFEPGSTNGFFVTSRALNARITLACHPRFMHNVRAVA